MLTHLQFPPVFFIYITTAILSGVLAFIAWTRRPAAGAGAIGWVMVGCALWSLGDALEHLMINFTLKQWVDLSSYLGILLVPAAWLVFTIQYTGKGRSINRRLLAALTIEPLLVVIAILTDPYHHLFYSVRYLSYDHGFVHLFIQHGPLFLVHSAYSYILIAVGMFLLARSMINLPAIYRKQSLILILSALLPGGCNLAYIASTRPFVQTDFTPLSFLLTGVLVLFGVYRYKLLDLTPRGRDALIEKMDDLVVVTDNFDRVVDINLAACNFVNIRRDQIIGHVLSEFLAPWPGLFERFSGVRESRETITLQIADELKYFDLQLSPIYGPQNAYLGQLIILRDVTAIQKVQEALRESESRYRSLVDTSPDAIIMVTPKSIVSFYNKAAAFLFNIQESESIIGHSAYDFIDIDYHQQTAAVTEIIYNTGIQQTFEALFHTSDGRAFPGELNVSLLRDSSNQPTAFVCVLRDISERKRTEDEVRRSAIAEHEQREIADALREMGIVLNTTLDIETLLDHLLKQVARIIPFDSGNVTFIKGRKAVVVRSIGYEQFGENVIGAVNQFVFNIESTENFNWMIEHKQPLIIADTQQYPHWLELEATSYIRSWLGAPILARGQVFAFFSLDKCEPGFYTAEHAQILTTFAAQAGLALQNALLFQETTEMLNRTVQLNLILQKIGGTLDLSTLLSEVLELSCGMLNASAGLLGLYNPQTQALEPSHTFVASQRDISWEPQITSGMSWQVFKTGDPALVSNINAHPELPDRVAENHITSFLIVPVRSAQEIMGVLSFYNFAEQTAFLERDVPIAVTLGREAGEAIRTAQLFKAVRKRAEEAENLREASSAVTSALNLEVVLDQIISNLDKVVPFDSCTIFLNEDDHLRIVANRGFDSSSNLIGTTYSCDNSLVRETYTSRLPLIIKDAQIDPRYEKWGQAGHVHGWMGIPLFARGNIIGFLTVDSRRINAYSVEDAILAQAFANQAAIAIENAQLYERTQHLAITDPLTELFNRRHFFDLSKKEFYRARRYAKPLSVLMIDVDDLKLVNDSYGHIVGDQLIEFIGRQIRAELRYSDIAGRYAGDEFVILLPDSDLPAAVNVGERLNAGIANGIVTFDGQSVSVSVSIGISSLKADSFSLETLINQADQALYAAKNTTKNTIFIWSGGKAVSSANRFPDEERS